MSGSESYESLKISFADAWNEISEVIADGEVEIKSGQKVPVKVFLGGDYEVCVINLLICSRSVRSLFPTRPSCTNMRQQDLRGN